MRVRLFAKCNNCGSKYDVDIADLRCPKCGSEDGDVYTMKTKEPTETLFDRDGPVNELQQYLKSNDPWIDKSDRNNG